MCALFTPEIVHTVAVKGLSVGAQAEGSCKPEATVVGHYTKIGQALLPPVLQCIKARSTPLPPYPVCPCTASWLYKAHPVCLHIEQLHACRDLVVLVML